MLNMAAQGDRSNTVKLWAYETPINRECDTYFVSPIKKEQDRRRGVVISGTWLGLYSFGILSILSLEFAILI